ncbi:alpha-L-rhamnosidase C-terminal domain-containing protein [Streptomyces sp. NPDC006465]|uniref:alpha-L-rhamnosidase C-terminal domain-containing protein n=1 Tax=Streptomyces sp. NPDC006465 TaxID=3157174 RepID=UPI0033B7D1AC
MGPHGARTPYGLAEVAWERAEGELRVEVTVPTGSVATVVLPGLEPGRSNAAGIASWCRTRARRPITNGTRPRPFRSTTCPSKGNADGQGRGPGCARRPATCAGCGSRAHWRSGPHRSR